MVIAAVMLFRVHRLVGITVSVVIPILVLLTLWQLRSQAGIRIHINQAREDQGVRVAEAILGIEQVKVFCAELREAFKAGSVARTLADREYRHHVVMAIFDFAKWVVERVGYFVTLILSISLSLQPGNHVGIGGVLTILLLYDHINEPVRHLHRLIDEAHERWLLSRDFMSILDISPMPEISTFSYKFWWRITLRSYGHSVPYAVAFSIAAKAAENPQGDSHLLLCRSCRPSPLHSVGSDRYCSKVRRTFSRRSRPCGFDPPYST
jgi:ABC-type bacteriocin/lantibiotic exporter with double-glycine peptidase domain